MESYLAEVLKALIPIVLVETGALVFFCGVVSVNLVNHGRRLDKVEDRCEKRICMTAGKTGLERI
jgi:hypothetical protein